MLLGNFADLSADDPCGPHGLRNNPPPVSDRRWVESSCWLVVYLNISEWGIRQSETEAIIAATKARYADAFEAISFLWKDRSY
jgi:hypothetical protein